MDLGCGILDSLKNKSILVTGSTGFLAKIFVEKVLRVQPDVKKLYLLIRAPDDHSAQQRLQLEVVGKELFCVLKEKHGKDFQGFIADKLSAVAGDITEENLGIKNDSLAQTLMEEIDVVVNVAANTTFNERYDKAMGTNVLGPKHAMEFAKKCPRLELFLHVSTAYVAGPREGLVLEKKMEMGETLNGKYRLDIDAEMSLIVTTLKELSSDETRSEREIKLAMRELGMKRAQRAGWPNTYVFTKAMGEMMLGAMKGNTSLVIFRPAIITSICNDPVPGWMEGARTIDSLIISYSKGKLDCFLVDVDLVMDVIPGDMVSNAMIAAVLSHLNRPSEFIIYHVGSSVRNPVKYSGLVEWSRRYFTVNPQFGKDGRIIKARKIPMFHKMNSFRGYMNLRYNLPLQGLRVANAAFCHLFSQTYNEMNRKYNFVIQLAELYEPFTFFKGCFDDLNLEKLRRVLDEHKEDEAAKMLLPFDAKLIDWNKYFLDIHIPGLIKFVRK